MHTEQPHRHGLTERETLCLGYIENTMGLHAFAVGRFICANLLNPKRGGSNLSAIGAAVLGRLRRRGLVTLLHNEGLWRITDKGRDALRRGPLP